MNFRMRFFCSNLKDTGNFSFLQETGTRKLFSSYILAYSLMFLIKKILRSKSNIYPFNKYILSISCMSYLNRLGKYISEQRQARLQSSEVYSGGRNW